MNTFQIIILSIVEGLTEFLPVSSTAHLIITSKILNLPQSGFQKLFEVFIQGGAILSVVFLYRKLLFKSKKLLINILVSFIPTGIAGFLFYKLIKNIFFESLKLISFSLIFIGIFFFLLEYLILKGKLILNKEIKDMNFKEAFLIGLFQSLAIIPGISRAGIVIITMLVMRFKRESSAVYSFLLAMPTIILASFYDLYKSKELLISNNINNIFNLFLGFFLSFIFALISVKFFINYLRKNTLIFFGFYRIIIGIFTFFL